MKEKESLGLFVKENKELIKNYIDTRLEYLN
jgi:hypothetical protein